MLDINTAVFEKVQLHQAKILAVTKYWDLSITQEVLHFGKENFREIFYGIGENRIRDIFVKNTPVEDTHFIGNIQSRDISQILECCSVVHSLCQIQHAKIMNKICIQNNKKIKIFVQLNISNEGQKRGLVEKYLEENFREIFQLPRLEVIGISAIGRGDFTISEKQLEFRHLRKIRESLLPGGLISAGTSRDYEIALDEGIDIVRVGKSLF